LGANRGYGFGYAGLGKAAHPCVIRSEPLDYFDGEE